MKINRQNETHCGILWERYDIEPYFSTFFREQDWCVEFSSEKKCWELWRNTELLFGSPLLIFVFMVARELVLEEVSNNIIPMWLQ